MKRVLTSCLVVLICLTAFLSGYGKGCYSYATNQDGTLTNDELDVAVSSWLQSHGGNLFSPQNYRARKTYEAGLLHNFIYGDGGGYDAIRKHINGGVGGNNELKFDFDGFIIQKLNTWLNRELQNGSFGQGAELNENGMFNNGTNNVVYSGFYSDKYNSFVTLYKSDLSVYKYGSVYLYDNSELVSKFKNGETSVTIPYNNNSVNYTLRTYRSYIQIIGQSNISLAYNSNPPQMYNGFVSIGVRCDDNGDINNYNSQLGVAFYDNDTVNTTYSKKWYTLATGDNLQQEVQDTNVNFITFNNNNISVYPTIVDADGHLYITPKVNVGVDGEVNYQPYIVNEGDTINNVINQYYIDSNTPDKTISYPTDNPNDTGGGGDNPSGGNPPNWTNPFPHLSPDGEGGFNFNFQLPDLNIDWNISGLKDKFPFSIPFDLIHFVEVLNAEPETPEFDWTIDLKIYQWHIDADLHEFDNLAGIVRNVEFIGFCITLVLITRRMIKG